MKENFDLTFSLKCSLQTACAIYVTMDSLLGLGSEIGGSDMKNTPNLCFFFKTSLQ